MAIQSEKYDNGLIESFEVVDKSGLGANWTQTYPGWGMGDLTIPGEQAPWQYLGTLAEEPSVSKCRCGRDWHTAPLRQRVATMLAQHKFDPDYSTASDDSPIVCVGSDTLGPGRPPIISSISITVGLEKTQKAITAMCDSLTKLNAWPTFTLPQFVQPWVIYDEPFAAVSAPCDIPELDIQPELWPIAEKSDKWVAPVTRTRVNKALRATRKEWRQPVVTMPSPGLDVSALTEKFNEKYNPKYPTKGST